MTATSLAEREAALAAVAEIVEHEPEADRILRAAVTAIARACAGVRWCQLAFVEGDGLAPGPLAGARDDGEAPTLAMPVEYDGGRVGELQLGATAAADEADRAWLAELAATLAPYCLVGWDTDGEEWEYGLGLDISQ